MNGIAPVLIILLFGAAVAGAAAVVSTYYDLPKEPATNSTDPVEIVSTGAANAPWDAFYDLFFGGLWGVLVWIVSYFISPLINAAGSLAAGHQISFPAAIGYFVLTLLVLGFLWRKKESIYDFLTKAIIWIGVSVMAILAIGIVLKFIGAI